MTMTRRKRKIKGDKTTAAAAAAAAVATTTTTTTTTTTKEAAGSISFHTSLTELLHGPTDSVKEERGEQRGRNGPKHEPRCRARLLGGEEGTRGGVGRDEGFLANICIIATKSPLHEQRLTKYCDDIADTTKFDRGNDRQKHLLNGVP